MTIASVGVLGATVGVGMISVTGDASTRQTAAEASANGVATGAPVAAAPAPSAAVPAPSAAAPPDSAPDSAIAAALKAHADASRGTDGAVSRAGTRPVLASVQRATKARALPVSKQDVSGAVTETIAPADPRDIAMGMLGDYGWSSDQFSCLDELYIHESGWDPTAENPSSGAFGIPQALPGDKMAAYGADWQTNPETQLAWGLAYIRDSYGSPCGAWGFWQANNWY